MGFRLLKPDETPWRPTNVLGAEYVDLRVSLSEERRFQSGVVHMSYHVTTAAASGGQ